MNIYDTVEAHTIEVGDQIIIKGDPIEVTSIEEDPEAPLEGLIIKGYSHDTGDIATYDDVWFGDYVDLWAV